MCHQKKKKVTVSIPFLLYPKKNLSIISPSYETDQQQSHGGNLDLDTIVSLVDPAQNQPTTSHILTTYVIFSGTVDKIPHCLWILPDVF